ncbi:hypothetical protein KI387_017965 [Taxus chinensis]|uniref:Pentatricopeptide repeat-containing protein n=1 Tax=Taxus chinensis TaxID=29808 RepID=A0AA38GHR9_TAXCH|nr:hypothetical protein KI387_017965 [Taxus chinensis]
MSSITHLGALCREGRLKEAIQILITTDHLPEDSRTYLQLLQACIAKNALSEGKMLHSFISARGFTFATHTCLQNELISMYAHCGSLVNARNVFDHMTERDPTGVQPDQFTFASIVPACANMGALEQGMDIHQRIIDSGFLSDVVVSNALIDMYAKCGSIHKAHELFDKMIQRDAFSWTAMIAGYAQNGLLDEAFRLLNTMLERNSLQDAHKMGFLKGPWRFSSKCNWQV